jgi:cyanate permease
MPKSMMTAYSSPRHRHRARWLLALGMVLIGINLRPALSSLAPVLGQVKTEIGLSATMAGLLTTLPVLCLGLFGPLAPQLARRFGSERSIAGACCCWARHCLRSQLGLSAWCWDRCCPARPSASSACCCRALSNVIFLLRPA